MESKLAKKLKAAQAKWQKASTRSKETTQFDEIDDGRYLARLVGAEITESKSSGRIQIAWTWKIAEGDYKGATKMSFDGMETEDNLVYVARMLTKLGYELPDDLDDVEAILKDVVASKPLCRVRLRTRGEFQNVYLDRVFDPNDENEALEDAAGDVEPAEEEATDEGVVEEEGIAEEAPAEEEGVEEEPADEGVVEEDGDEVELSEGMTVIVTGRGQGKVIEITEDEKVRVKLDDGKIVRVTGDKLEIPEAEPEPIEPPKKATAKAAVKKAKK